MNAFLQPHSRAVLVACMPKSGSTFLSALIAEIPGFRREHIVPSYRRREQELDEDEIQRAFNATQTLRRAFQQGGLKDEHRPRGFVCQNHVRHNHETETLIDRYEIVPICLVRNIFDIVVSLRDHFANESPYTPTAYVDEKMAAWEPARMYEFLVDMSVPWYIHFYVSWYRATNRVMVSYENLIDDPKKELRKALAYGKLSRSDAILDDALAKVTGAKTRKNVGRSGRGNALTQDLRDRVSRFCAYYEDVDFSPIGIV